MEKKYIIIYWECNPDLARVTRARCLTTDGWTQTKGKEHHKITREKCPAFAGIVVVISLPIPLGKMTTAFAFYHLQLWIASPALETWHALVFETPLGTFQCPSSQTWSEWLLALSPKKSSSQLSLSSTKFKLVFDYGPVPNLTAPVPKLLDASKP